MIKIKIEWETIGFLSEKFGEERQEIRRKKVVTEGRPAVVREDGQ